MSEDEYIKEGDLILISIEKQISEVRIADIAPSGRFIKVTSPHGHNAMWIRSEKHVETLESLGEDSDYIDISEVEPGSESAQDILNKIRNRAKEFDEDEPIESEVIQIDRFTELDLRNQKK